MGVETVPYTLRWAAVAAALLFAGCASSTSQLSPGDVLAFDARGTFDWGVGSTTEDAPKRRVAVHGCGGGRAPEGWPRMDSSREVLAPFLACATPAEFVAMQAGGVLALSEAGGDPVKAEAALMARASRERPGPAAMRGAAGRGGVPVATVMKEAEGLPAEVLEAKWAQADLEATGTRLPADVGYLREHPPSLETPPPGLAGSARWNEYVGYREARLTELEGGARVKGPLKWEGYEKLRGDVARGLEFERAMVSKLRADVRFPKTQRRWLGDFDAPRIETHVGVMKVDLRFADTLIIEEQPKASQPLHVETFSFKSRDFRRMNRDLIVEQMASDARDALRYYGEALNIRRLGLERAVWVQRVRLVYDGALKPGDPLVLEYALNRASNRLKSVEIVFE